MKNNMTPADASSTNAGYCIASVSLRPHLLGSRPLGAQHFQHLIERARNLADTDQRGIHRRKQRRMAGERIRKAFARQQRGAELADHRPQPAHIGVTRQ
jgi:hypothetical protein